MKNTINNTQKANEIKVNGNCKGVKDITNNIDYNSVKEAALANGVRNSTMSVAINRGYLCNGSRFMFQKDLYNNTDKLCAENAKANARAAKAEAKLSEMEELRAKANAYDHLMAEQEAKRKAEEARLEKERKEEEKRQAKVTKLEDKIERLETLIDRKRNEEQKLVAKRNKALEELKALDNGKEVE
jgi:septal ring factor EnvC (AmiA/AmiB activator)